MNEWLMIAVMAGSGILFAAGGTDLNGRGYKWLRRFVLPIGLGVTAFLFTPWWSALGYAATLSVFLHLGYGSKASWLYRAIIFAGYGSVSLWFGFSWWTAASPLVLGVLFAASNWRPTASTVFWKSWEFIAGVMIALCFIASIQNRWQ